MTPRSEYEVLVNAFDELNGWLRGGRVSVFGERETALGEDKSATTQT